MAWIVSRNRLSNSEMANNATELYNYLNPKGWSLNAIAGVLGNMQAESSINPGVVQGYVTTNPKQAGYGLIQWTASTTISSVEQNPLWAWIYATFGDYEWDNGERQSQFINTDDRSGWIKRGEYQLSYDEFKQSTQTPEYLASAYLRCRERPASYDTESVRQNNARYWYNYLQGATPTPTYYVTVRPSSARLYTGDTLQLNATVSVPGGAPTTVYWTSSNNAVTVDESGLVTIGENASGTANIVATSVYNSSLKGSCNIVITELKEYYIKITPNEAKMYRYKELELVAEIVLPEGASTKVTWKSDNKNVTVNQIETDTSITPPTSTVLVKVGGSAKGKITITCTSNYDKTIYDECTIYITRSMPIYFYHRSI